MRPGARQKLEGIRFGRLVAIARGEPDAKRNARWRCRCDCGTEKLVYQQALNSGVTRSCGCLIRETTKSFHTTHGRSKEPLFKVWVAMVQRCTNPNDKKYRHYGGRGIAVCERWRSDFTAFAADMGPRPPGGTIDRIDNDGNYEPANCRWATKAEQNSNRRTTLMVQVDGQEIPLSEACKRYRIPYATARHRLHRGWPVSRILELDMP